MPSNPDFNPGNKMTNDKTKSTFNKRQGLVRRGKRVIVDSETRDRDPNKSFHTGSASSLEPTVLDASDKKQKKQLEIMITPKTLELPYQMYQPKIGSITNEGNSVLRCASNPLTTSRCLGKDQILLSDLEQESDVLFGCK